MININTIKLACSTVPFKGWDLAAALNLCSSNGISGIELRMGFHNWSVEQMRNELAARKMRVTNVGSSIAIKRYDPTLADNFRTCVSLAHKLNAPAIRIFLGNFIVKVGDPCDAIDEEGIVSLIRELCAEDIEVWIETHNEYATGQSLRRLLDKIDMPNCKIIWDVIHPIEAGEMFAQTLDYIWEDVAHVHFKDGHKNPDLTKANYLYTRLGEGTLPLAQIVQELRLRKFNGYVSLEWENAWKNEISAITAHEVVPKFAELLGEKL